MPKVSDLKYGEGVLGSLKPGAMFCFANKEGVTYVVANLGGPMLAGYTLDDVAVMHLESGEVTKHRRMERTLRVTKATLRG